MEANNHSTSLLDLPNDILSQILKLLPLVPDIWNCILVCKHLKTACNLPTIWNYVTIQTSSFKRRKRNYYDTEDENTKLKKTTLSVNPRQLVKFLVNNHAKDIIELDLTGAIFETERDHNSRRKIYSRRTAINDSEEITNLLTDLLLRLPNIQRLSLRASGWESGSKPLPGLRKTDRESTLRELNLNHSTLVNLKPKQLKRLLQTCPKLETLFVAGLALDANCAEILGKFGKKLKSLDLTSSAASTSYLARELPDLTLLINMKNEWEANNRPTEDMTGLRQNLTLVTSSIFRNTIWKSNVTDIKGIVPAVKNLTFCDVFGSTLFHKFVDADITVTSEALLRYFVTDLGFNVNVAVIDRDRVRINPWIANFPYDTSHDNMYGEINWNNNVAKTLEVGDTALHKAVKMNRLHHAKVLMSVGANVNARNKDGRTPLCYANHQDTVAELLKAGADATVIDRHGWSVLMNFIANKSRLPNPNLPTLSRTQILEELITAGAAVDHRAKSGLSALEIALLSADWKMAERLLEYTLPSNNIQKTGLGPLHCLCLAKVAEDGKQAQLEALEALLKTDSIDMLRTDDQVQTAMHVACIIKRFDLAEKMLLHASSEEAVKLFALPDKAGYTALHYAFLPELKEETSDRNQHSSYNRSMLVNGKDTWIKNLKQAKAKLPSLTVEGEDFFVSLMKTPGLDFNVKSKNNETPLLLLCKSICTDEVASKLARRLLESGGDPNIPDDQGTTPLQLAAYTQKEELVKLLLLYSADANIEDNKGINALIAAAIGYLKVTEEFAEQRKRIDQYSANNDEVLTKIEDKSEKAVQQIKGILDAILPMTNDVNKPDGVLGKTALHYLCACTSATDYIKQLVLEYSANMETRDIIGETPIHDTLRKSNWQNLKTLIDLGCDVNSVGSRGCSPLHKALSTSEIYRLSRVEGDLFAEGYKIVGHSLVFYPSWLWVSIEDDETTVNSNNRVYRNDWEYYEQMYRLVFVLFTVVEKLDFNLVNSRGELPLHLAWFFDEEERIWVDTVFADFPYVPKNVSKQDLAWVIPLLMLQHATKEHLNTPDKTGQSPFHALLCTNYVRPSYYSTRSPSFKPGVAKIVKMCLEKGVDISLATPEGENSLIMACRNNVYSDILEIMLDQCSPEMLNNVIDDHGDTLLHKILSVNRDTRDENDNAVLLLLERFPHHINEFNDDGYTPLMVFIKDFDYSTYNRGTPPKSKISEALLKFKGIDVNARSLHTGETALHLLCAWWFPFSVFGAFYNNSDLFYHVGNDNMLVQLIEAGADASIKDNKGKTCYDVLPNLHQLVEKYGQFMLRKAKLSSLPKPDHIDLGENQQTRVLDMLQVTFAHPPNVGNEQNEDGEDLGFGLFD